MQHEIISVIIPIYNVETYLERCLKSVIGQSYQELEILLIDDGSTDGSGILCDQWAENDPRIKVIHKSNGGLSDARNTGLDHASGEYIVFIDSDDYISSDMVLKLYLALKANNAEMSICNFLCVNEAGLPVAENTDLPINNETVSGLEAVRRIVNLNSNGWYYIPAWNKLYKKNLFTEIRFPIGKIHEDEFVAHKLLGLCKTVACIQDVCYFYVQRTGSIIHSKTSKSYLHASEALLDRAQFYVDNELNYYASRVYWRAAMFLASSFQFRDNSQPLQEPRIAALRVLRQNRWLRKYCSIKEKLQISTVCFSPYFYCFLFRNPIRQRMKVLFKQVFILIP